MWLIALFMPPIFSYLFLFFFTLVNGKYIKEYIVVNSVILAYFIPMADVLGRYRVLGKIALEFLESNSFKILLSNEFIYDFFFLLGKLLNINYYFVLYIYILTINYLWFNIYAKYSERIKSKLIRNYFFILFILTLLHRNILDLNKFFLALLVLLYSIQKIEIEKNKKYYILFFITIFIHNSMIMIILIYLFSIFFRIKNKKVSKLLLVIIMILSPFKNIIFEKLYPYTLQLNEEIAKKLNVYIFGGYWNKNIFLESNFKGLLTYYLLNLIIFIFLLYLLNNIPKNKTLNRFWNFNFYLGISSLFFFRSYVFNERLGNSFIVSFVIYIYIEYVIQNLKEKRKDMCKKIIILFLIFFNFSLNIYVNGIKMYDFNTNNRLKKENDSIKRSMKIFYIPTLFLLNFDNGYSDEWLDKWKNDDFKRKDVN